MRAIGVAKIPGSGTPTRLSLAIPERPIFAAYFSGAKWTNIAIEWIIRRVANSFYISTSV